MEVWLEVAPSTNRGRVLERVSMVKEMVDAVFVPEAPLGYPRAHAIAVAHVVKEALGVRAFASLRTLDVNTNALISLLGASLVLGIDGVIVTRGDRPAFGSEVRDVGTEDAIRIARSDKRLRSLKLGVVVSLAKGYAKISERLLGLDIDLALISRLWRAEQLDHEVFKEARKKGVKLYPYIVVSSEEERERLFSMLQGHQRVFLEHEVPEFVKELEDLVDGIVITAPLNFRVAIKVLESVRKIL